MACPEDRFVVVPVSRLSAENDSTKLAAQIQFIRDRIVGKTNEEIINDQAAMNLLAEIGPDQNILAYAFNFKTRSGEINTDLTQTNLLNKALYDRLSIDPGHDIYGYDLIFSTTDLNAAQYGATFINDYKCRLGVGASAGDSITVLRSVVMDPWVTETTKGSFIDILEHEFRTAVTESLKELGY
jgi:hypothetical protein